MAVLVNLHVIASADPRAVFDFLVRKAGFSRLTFHGLRHAHATLALTAGVNPKIVSERLGHSTIAVTMDTYSHVLPGMQEEAAKAVEDLLIQARRKRLATDSVADNVHGLSTNSTILDSTGRTG